MADELKARLTLYVAIATAIVVPLAFWLAK